MTAQHDTGRLDRDPLLRWTAVLFGVALALHGADHLRRGMAAVPQPVMIAGNLQIVAAVITVVLVFRGSRWAPHAAVAVGFVSAMGFTAAHLLPKWGPFSDSFINAASTAHVNWYSWVTAIAEISADLIFATAGIVVLAARRADSSRNAPADAAHHVHG